MGAPTPPGRSERELAAAAASGNGAP
jgi:hypothetical protein